MMHPRSTGAAAETPSAAAGAMRRFGEIARDVADGMRSGTIGMQAMPGHVRMLLEADPQLRSQGPSGASGAGRATACACLGARHACSLDAAANIAREGERLLREGSAGHAGTSGAEASGTLVEQA